MCWRQGWVDAQLHQAGTSDDWGATSDEEPRGQTRIVATVILGAIMCRVSRNAPIPSAAPMVPALSSKKRPCLLDLTMNLAVISPRAVPVDAFSSLRRSSAAKLHGHRRGSGASSAKAEEDEEASLELHQRRCFEPSDDRACVAPSDSGDLVDHEEAVLA